MALNVAGGLGGAAQGASAGAAFGPIGAGIGGILGGVGGLFGKKKKARQPDLTPLINTINESSRTNKNLISSVRPQNIALGDQYKRDVSGVASGLRNDVAGLGNIMVERVGDTSGQLADATFRAGRQRILESEPEQTQNLREAIASSGTNRGGAFLALKAKQDQERGRALGDLNTQVGLQSLQAKQNALRDAFGADTAAAESATGLNAGALDRLFASGREDLIDEAMNLVNEERDRSGKLLGIQGQQAQNKFAADLANDRQKQGLLDTIIGGIGGTIGGLAQNRRDQQLLSLLGKK